MQLPNIELTFLPCYVRSSRRAGRWLLRKTLALTFQFDEPMPMIWADSGMLQQMMYNLLMNAIRYTTAGNIVVMAGREETGITISVIDTGIGIAADDIEYIFDYFYRVNPARAKQSGGTGLGLAWSNKWH